MGLCECMLLLQGLLSFHVYVNSPKLSRGESIFLGLTLLSQGLLGHLLKLIGIHCMTCSL